MSKPIGDAQRYVELGVSATKTDVHSAIASLSAGLSERTFCKVFPDIFGGDDEYVTVSHSDGAGSKSILAYLLHRLTGRLDGYRNVAQDAIVMNLDDLVCVGVTSGFLLTSIVNRNVRRVDGNALREIIGGKEDFARRMTEHGVQIHFAGGETADVGDVVQTVLIDANMASRFRREELLINRIVPGLSIVGLESSGPPASYETDWNSGIGCNGITLARHELLGGGIRDEFPEIADPSAPAGRAYYGPFPPLANLPATSLSVLEALLSPTRTFAPVMSSVYRRCRPAIRAVVHNTGGAHTKCVRFASECVIEKDLGSRIPAIFSAIQTAGRLSWAEMCKVFNLGYRMEIYCDASAVAEIIAIAGEYGVGASLIGQTSALPPGSPVELRVTVNGQAATIG